MVLYWEWPVAWSWWLKEHEALSLVPNFEIGRCRELHNKKGKIHERRGLFFGITTERGLDTRNQWGREGVKFENRNKAVSALSFIFTISVLNSSLAYVTVTWCCCWCSWVYELELMLTWFDIDVHECMDERWFEMSIVTSVIYFVYSHRTWVQ